MQTGNRRKRAPVAVALAIVAVLVSFVAGWGLWRAAAPPATLLVDASPVQVNAGEAIYRQRCASCHGANLEGEPDWRQRKPSGRLPAPPHDDSGHTWHHPDEVLVAITRDGMVPPLAPDGYQSDMPGFGAVLSDEEIRSVLAFIASRWSPRERAHQARVTQAHRAAR